MKKQILSEEFRRMQKLAGLLNEQQYSTEQLGSSSGPRTFRLILAFDAAGISNPKDLGTVTANTYEDLWNQLGRKVPKSIWLDFIGGPEGEEESTKDEMLAGDFNNSEFIVQVNDDAVVFCLEQKPVDLDHLQTLFDELM